MPFGVAAEAVKLLSRALVPPALGDKIAKALLSLRGFPVRDDIFICEVLEVYDSNQILAIRRAGEGVAVVGRTL